MPLIGREGELRILDRALAGAASREGGVIVLSGEPGIGKTSLLRELGLCAAGQGFASVYGRCLPEHLPNQDSIWQRIWRGLCGEAGMPRDSDAGSREFAVPRFTSQQIP